MRTFDFALEAKDIGDDGRVKGLAAAYGNVDDGGDMIVPGALAKAAAGLKSLPMLLYHDMRRPIGVWDKLTETPKGLEVEGRFSMATADAREAYALVKDGAISGLSIGYDTVKSKMDGAVRRLEQLKLFEVSLVSIPMNPKTRVTSVKELLADGSLPSVREFEEFLRDAGFPKSLAAGIASKAAALLRGEPDADADDALAFLNALRTAPVIDLTGE